jgi:hypothetical protein
VYQAHVETARENALKVALENVHMPVDVPHHQYIAWHAYMLVFEARNVMAHDAKLNGAFHSPESESFDGDGMRIL